MPQVIFTNPEVAAVGWTEAEARARGINARVVDYDIGQVLARRFIPTVIKARPA